MESDKSSPLFLFKSGYPTTCLQTSHAPRLHIPYAFAPTRTLTICNKNFPYLYIFSPHTLHSHLSLQKAHPGLLLRLRPQIPPTMASLDNNVSDYISIIFGTGACIIWVLCIYLALRTFWLPEEMMRLRGEAEGEEKGLLSDG